MSSTTESEKPKSRELNHSNLHVAHPPPNPTLAAPARHYAEALDVDKGGKPYVAAIEGAGDLPLFGVQFHPEKPMAEWDPALAIPHGAPSVLLSQSLANFFVGEARRSRRTPAAAGYTEDELVMANHRTTFVGKGGYRGTHFDEIYILD